MTNGNDLAYFQGNYREIESEKEKYPNNGLTKREYFAAMAMQGIMSSGQSSSNLGSIVKAATLISDALIKELNK